MTTKRLWEKPLMIQSTRTGRKNGEAASAKEKADRKEPNQSYGNTQENQKLTTDQTTAIHTARGLTETSNGSHKLWVKKTTIAKKQHNATAPANAQTNYGQKLCCFPPEGLPKQKHKRD